MIAATQKPSNDIVPTFVRDLFSFRMALRCTTPEASDTILGQGWAKEGYSASTLDPTTRGVGFLLAEGAVPVKIRTHYLDDEAIAELAERAEQTEGAVSSAGALARRPGRGRPGRPVRPPRPPARDHAGPRDRRAGRGRPASSPCKDRRAAVCPSCSRLYQADAWQLVAAGIRGGKGVAPSVVEHPQLFVTLTAPSFGPVHRTRRLGRERPRPCRPRRGAETLPARAVALVLTVRHGEDDPVVGEPSVPECFDYRGRGAVERARLALCGPGPRPPLPRGGPDRRAERRPSCARVARLSYIKVVEFQRRGLVHLHVVLRADGGAGPSDPPPPWLDAARARRRCIARVVGEAGVPVPGVEGTALRRARWGAQHDVRVLVADDDRPTPRPSPPTWPSTPPRRRTGRRGWPIRSGRRAQHRAPRTAAPHLAMVTHGLGARGPARARALRLRDHAHTLGYGGQFSSKSVRFSTTFGALRQARADYVRGESDEADFDYDGEWRYAGRGYANPEADALAATLLDARLEVARRVPTRFPIEFPEGFPEP